MIKNKLVTSVLIIIILILLVAIGVQSIPGALTLPSDAQKLSECVPNMGEHWANPADLPFGPVYLVDKGKVVGIEYMIHEDELENNILTIGEMRVGKSVSMPTLDAEYNYIELNYLPEGHEGDEEAHYDVHMYLVSKEEQQNLCK